MFTCTFPSRCRVDYIVQKSIAAFMFLNNDTLSLLHIGTGIESGNLWTVLEVFRMSCFTHMTMLMLLLVTSRLPKPQQRVVYHWQSPVIKTWTDISHVVEESQLQEPQDKLEAFNLYQALCQAVEQRSWMDIGVVNVALSVGEGTVSITDHGVSVLSVMQTIGTVITNIQKYSSKLLACQLQVKVGWMWLHAPGWRIIQIWMVSTPA